MISVAMNPGPYRVEANACRPELVGRVADHRLNAGLARGVGPEVRMGHTSGQRRHRHERPSPGGGQALHRVLDGEHGAHHVEVEHPLELVGVEQVVRPHSPTAAGVGHHPVQAPAVDVGRSPPQVRAMSLSEVTSATS